MESTYGILSEISNTAWWPLMVDSRAFLNDSIMPLVLEILDGRLKVDIVPLQLEQESPIGEPCHLGQVFQPDGPHGGRQGL